MQNSSKGTQTTVLPRHIPYDGTSPVPEAQGSKTRIVSKSETSSDAGTERRDSSRVATDLKENINLAHIHIHLNKKWTICNMTSV